mmetsp:Transcript_37863/g.91818  ORF Transcript_37863/g.91818 Transcript_37863/m.91818 type:complete len:209 (+) Transcript_37863:191-817(+)
MMKGSWGRLGAAVRPILTKIPRSNIASSAIIQRMALNLSTSHISSPSEDLTEVNELNQGSVQIKSTSDGRGHGVFAARHFEAGEPVIESIALESFDKPHSHSLQLDWKTHVDISLPGRLVNHMCDPNLKVQPNDSNAYDFVALTKIEEGTELGWDYETAEYQLSAPIQCGCGSPKCRKVVKGFRYNKDELLEAHGKDAISPYLLSEEG